MLKETTKKINFIQYSPVKGRPKDDSKPPQVRIDTKHGTIHFGKKALFALDMENKFIEFFYEPTKKLIGWKIKSKLEQGEFLSKIWRPIKTRQPGGDYITSITGIISQFARVEGSYKCEVKKYREVTDLLSRGEILYYVKLGKQQDQDEEN